ncbi:MAG: SDR family oxidoreductase [Alphaproteobacteria bacterium]|nr:SDR family oxidoreductase [Alphaproteobacteria bacterium]MBU0794986.1 SDR family oxidoreductase [Alphaproteobacteria bacterium]MBU0876644.1 SDR family oxidoreductase [Alphaproteobacteria bacterium]MBU1769346.1 SDR family oxidoreductase [Alphaproteobacteria bacterium]
MSLELGLKDKVAVITGGGVGIGKETARELALAGAKVVIAARTASKLEAAAAELRESTGGEIIAVPTDTTSMASVQALIDKTVAHFGAIHILVNCAAAPGGLVRNAIELADEDALMLDINTKLFGYFRTAKACVPHMRKAGWGRIVNVGGLTARCTEALSGMRNTALVHFTKTLSDEVGRDGITVNIIHPGVTRTEHIEEWFAQMAKDEGTTVDAIVEREAAGPAALKRMLEVEEVAAPIVFLCSQLGSGVTGESIAVDGGLSRAVFL